MLYIKYMVLNSLQIAHKQIYTVYSVLHMYAYTPHSHVYKYNTI